MREKTINAARGRWRGILRELDVDEAHLTGKHASCPMCGGKDRWRFDDKDGDGTWICSQCGAGTGMQLVQRMLGADFAEAARRVDEVLGNRDIPQHKPAPKPDARHRLRKIGEALKRLDGVDVVSDYLKGRGLSIIPDTLRIHPHLAYWEMGGHGKPVKVGHFPAMVALIQDPDGKPVTYHVTYIQDGRKADVTSPKKVMSGGIEGGAIRLYPVGPHLCIAEGIETALAVHEATELPAWATVSAGGMEAVVIPAEVRQVTIYADNDKNHVGQAAAYALAKRLTNEGRTVDVVVPGKPGDDFLDEWAARRRAWLRREMPDAAACFEQAREMGMTDREPEIVVDGKTVIDTRGRG